MLCVTPLIVTTVTVPVSVYRPLRLGLNVKLAELVPTGLSTHGLRTHVASAAHRPSERRLNPTGRRCSAAAMLSETVPRGPFLAASFVIDAKREDRARLCITSVRLPIVTRSVDPLSAFQRIAPRRALAPAPMCGADRSGRPPARSSGRALRASG